MRERCDECKFWRPIAGEESPPTAANVAADPPMGQTSAPGHEAANGANVDGQPAHSEAPAAQPVKMGHCQAHAPGPNPRLIPLAIQVLVSTTVSKGRRKEPVSTVQRLLDALCSEPLFVLPPTEEHYGCGDWLPASKYS